MSLVLWSQPSPGIGLILLNRPQCLNAMNEEMAEAFDTLVKNIGCESEQIRAIVLMGEGKAFSSGGDLQMLHDKMQYSQKEQEEQMLSFYKAFLSIQTLPVPVIAAVKGAAVGAGMALACACDLRVASESALFSLPFTKLGLHPGMGSTYLIERCVGKARASELMLTGRAMKAREAERAGLVANVVSDGKLEEEAIETAQRILECGREATTQLLKSLRGNGEGLQDVLKREAAYQGENYQSEEFAARIKSLTAKAS